MYMYILVECMEVCVYASESMNISLVQAVLDDVITVDICESVN